MDKVTRQCPQTTTEKGEPKQIRTEVPLLTSLTPYRWAKPAHIRHTQQRSRLQCRQAGGRNGGGGGGDLVGVMGMEGGLRVCLCSRASIEIDSPPCA